MRPILLDLPEQLETERLILRPYRAGDGIAYLDVCLRSKAHLLPYEVGNPALEVQTLEDAEALVREFAVEWLARRAFFLGAWMRETPTFVAQVYIGVVSRDLPEFEIGYFVDPAHEGKGYVTEAAGAAVRFCFDHLRAQRLRLGCNETNVRSWRVAERLGFQREAYIRETHPNILREDFLPSGDYLYGLLRRDYEASQESPQP